MINFDPIKHGGQTGIVNFINQLFEQAIHGRASDIHIEPSQNLTRIRLRIDGDLQIATSIPTNQHESFISRLKILANLDIAERRLPQDGKFQITTYGDQQIDCRLSTCPSIYGEKAVIRLLNSEQQALALDKLGLKPKQLTCLQKTIQLPQGLVLVTGPTGSGKTFTLYSILQTINQVQKNIVSIEDPVEINLLGITQVNTHDKIGLSFAKTLRAFLRQDPDIIMVGEIRDSETADITLKAAQTGHLVFATMHSNSASEALTRLRDMGIPNYLLAHSINLVIAQRLVKLQPGPGRIGKFELLNITPDMRTMILQHDYLGLAKHYV